MKLFQNPDGANAQARAVLAYLSNHDGIEPSWDAERKDYLADPTVARWHNCREQGYVVMLRSRQGGHQVNIAFYEHRNTDDICAVEWEQKTVHGNPPTLDTMPDGTMRDKWDITNCVPAGHAEAMAKWIFDRLTTFWLAYVDEPTLEDVLRQRRGETG